MISWRCGVGANVVVSVQCTFGDKGMGSDVMVMGGGLVSDDYL